MERRLFVSVNPFHARHVRENYRDPKNFLYAAFNQCIEASLSNPKTGHTADNSRRDTIRSGKAGSGKICCKQTYFPRKQLSTMPFEEISPQHFSRSTINRGTFFRLTRGLQKNKGCCSTGRQPGTKSASRQIEKAVITAGKPLISFLCR